jgi:hypothetical protein
MTMTQYLETLSWIRCQVFGTDDENGLFTVFVVPQIARYGKMDSYREAKNNEEDHQASAARRKLVAALEGLPKAKGGKR